MANKRKLPRGVAATVVIYSPGTDAFLMIKRKWDPDRGKYAFPGGMMEVDKEDLTETAVREVEEETGLKVDKTHLTLLEVLSDPKRDPKGHVVDVAYIITMPAEIEPEPESHETFAKWHKSNELETMQFAMGHRQLFDKAKKYLKQNKREYLSSP